MTAELSIEADLHAAINGLTAAIQRQERDKQRWAQVIRQIPLAGGNIPLSAGAGTLDQPDALKAKTGYNWSVRRLSITGFSAGSVSVLLNSPFGEVLDTFPAAAVKFYAQGGLLLHDDDRLVFTATGITGNVTIGGAADCFESWYLPYYLD